MNVNSLSFRRGQSPLLALAIALSLSARLCAGEAFVSVRQAIDLAQEQLDLRGLQSSVRIESVALKPATLLGSTRVWTVLWSASIPSDPGRFEIGVEVDMNGKVTRLAKKTARGTKTAP
jgi:hypothetical protein